MSSGFVKVMLIGNLGADPEVKSTASGTMVCNMRIACNERVKGKEGSWENKVEWVPVVCFGKTAESAAEYLKKGRPVYVEGRLQKRTWDDKDGNKWYTTEVVAFQVLFLGGDGGGKARNESAPAPEKALSEDDMPF